jgi:hypothetical protein
VLDITSQAGAWADFAPDLAAWALENMVNRNDAWGQYLPLAARTITKKVITLTGELTKDILAKHFVGADVGDLIGLHTTSPDNMCRWIAVDIDHHGSDDLRKMAVNFQAAITLFRRAEALGFDPLLISSNGRGGFHVIVLFDDLVPSPEAFAFVRWLIRDWPSLGLDSQPETFPKQPMLTSRVRYGNWLRMPGRHHTLPYYSGVWSGESWLWAEAANDWIITTTAEPFSLVPADAKTYADESHKPARQPFQHPDPARPVAKVLARLQNVVQSRSDQWSALCPAHGDQNNSLSVSEGDDRRVLLFCHAGCDIEAIVKALDLKMHDLFHRNRTMSRHVRYRKSQEPTR